MNKVFIINRVRREELVLSLCKKLLPFLVYLNGSKNIRHRHLIIKDKIPHEIETKGQYEGLTRKGRARRTIQEMARKKSSGAFSRCRRMDYIGANGVEASKSLHY
jgi:hypothetical protein